MKKLASTKGISKEEWIRLRMQGIGGSEAATAVGISRYHSRINLYLQKIGDLPIPQIDNERLYWGTVLEDVIAKEFSKRTGYGIQKLNYIIQHDDFPFMIGDIDRLILDDQGPIGILECKNTSAYMEKEWTEDNFPIDYIVQIQHYLAITGYQFGYFAV
ncbi:MAG: YqaJ viral recombinase family protein, partial [Nitrososphaeria archaeon]